MSRSGDSLPPPPGPGFRRVRWTPDGPAPWILPHETAFVVGVGEGALLELPGGGPTRLSGGDWALGAGPTWDGARAGKAGADGREGRFEGLAVPTDWVMGTRLGPDVVSALASGVLLKRGDLPEALAGRMEAWEGAEGVGAVSARLAVELEVESWLLRFEAGLPVAQTRPSGATVRRGRLDGAGNDVRRRVAAMTDFLAARFVEAPSVGEVCRAARIPEAYGAALFKKVTGETIRGYLDRLRFAEARRRLAQTEERIVEVALACGFRTQSRFYEGFTRAFGMAPAAYRERVRSLRGSGSGVRGFVGGAGRLPTAAGTARGPRFPLVLWVDDRPANNWDERLFLHELGVFSDCHTENASALAAAEQAGHDVVISDIWRGRDADENGWGLLQELRRRGSRVPVLFYTGEATPDLQERAAALGAQGVFDRSRPLIEALLTLLAPKISS